MSSSEYTVDPVERVQQLIGYLGPISSNQSISYSFDRGYERVEFDNGQQGGMTYVGTYHPGDSMCHAQEEEVIDGSEGICVHCGRTLM